MKDSKLTLRVTYKMKNDLEFLADMAHRTLSNYVYIKLQDIITIEKARNKSASESEFAEREERIKAIAAKIEQKI